MHKNILNDTTTAHVEQAAGKFWTYPISENRIKGNAMFNFSQSLDSAAVRSQLESQMAFYTDLSKRIFDGVQKMNELNIQAAQTMWEESIASAQQLWVSKDQYETLSIAAAQSQPAAEKARAYRQHVQNIIAETQVGIAKTMESHMPQTTRAAEAVAREVAQKASEETAKATQRQKEAMEKLATPINQPAARNSQGGVIKSAS